MSKRVLVVDDSNLMRHRTAECLAAAGHLVVGKAKDGGEAVELYQQLKPDVVTMDVTMRRKDGIAAAREILALDAQAAIVFYTLMDSPNMEEEIRKLATTRMVRKGDEDGLLQTLAAMD